MTRGSEYVLKLSILMDNTKYKSFLSNLNRISSCLIRSTDGNKQTNAKMKNVLTRGKLRATIMQVIRNCVKQSILNSA